METIQISLADMGLDAGAIIAGAERSAVGIGKTKQSLGATIVRELTIIDKKDIGGVAVGVNTTPSIKRLRDSHHSVAKLMAQGATAIEIAAATGYSISRISILKDDPSFIELVEGYRTIQKQVFVDTMAKMKNVTDDALGIIQERMEADPDTFSNSLLLEVVKGIGDRAGFSPVQKSQSVSVVLSPDDIARVKAGVRGAQNGKVKTIEQRAGDGEYTVVSGGAGVDNGETSIGPRDIRETSEVEGDASEGSNVREFSREKTATPDRSGGTESGIESPPVV